MTEEQSRLFTAPVVFWLAESKYETGFRPVAVYEDETPVGFAVYVVHEDGTGEIEAVMIDQRHQGRGHGRAAMEQLVGRLRDRYGCREAVLSHRTANYPAARLYESMGFRALGGEEGVVVRRLAL
ncbi:hypothetical protein J31TS4_23500 [Paenibacillus sp. J31TS4]|nr:hypothetical protein J31TS4_23500 [Paenibacillus sp. J31TS4]